MLTLIFVIALSTAVDPDPFLVKPYLQLGDAPKLSGSESLVLLWHAAASGPAAAWKVEVQSAKQWRAMSAPASERIEIPGIEPHLVYRATLSKLAPGGEFRYRVSKAGAVVFEATARARKSARQAQHFVVFGDIAQGNPSQRALAHQVAMAKPDFVAVMGDIVYGAGRISEYREKWKNDGNLEADALQAIVAGRRDRAIADAPELNYTMAAEILFLLETLEQSRG